MRHQNGPEGEEEGDDCGEDPLGLSANDEDRLNLPEAPTEPRGEQ